MILPEDKRWIITRLAEVGLAAHLVEAADPIAQDDQVKIFRDDVDTRVTILIGLTGGGFVNECRGEGPTRQMIAHGGSRSLDKAIDLAIAAVKAQQGAKTVAPYDLVARAIKGRVEAFSDRRLNDGDDVWRERELELRFGVAATANAIAVEFAASDAAFDLAAFAAACGLHVSDGRDTYSDCHPGELTWERPRTEEDQS